MRTQHYVRIFWIAAAAGCGVDEGELQQKHEDESNLIGGTLTHERPEIAAINYGCSAVLIAPQYAVTAAHCLDYSTAIPFRPPYRIQPVSAAGAPLGEYDVSRIHLFSAFASSTWAPAQTSTGDGVGNNDLALLRLAQPVPSSDVVPAIIASHPPAPNQLATMFGYGCTVWGQSADNRKRYYSFNYGTTTQAGCDGDSGGAVMIGPVGGGSYPSGALYGLVSQGGGGDVLASVVRYKSQIVQVMQNWEGTGPFEYGIDRPGSDYASFAEPTGGPTACKVRCESDMNCRAFTYFAPPGHTPTCFLKEAAAEWRPCEACISGIDFTRESSDRLGSDYTWFVMTEDRPDQCFAACARDSACQAYTFVPPRLRGGQGECHLKSNSAQYIANADYTSGARRDFEIHQDRRTDNAPYRTLNPVDRNQCARACAEDIHCKAFSHSYWISTCYLMKHAGDPVHYYYMHSNVKRGLELNTDRAGSDYRHFDANPPTPEHCQAICARESQCQAFTYVPPGIHARRARCYLKSSVPAASDYQGVVSGIKGAEFF